MNVVKISMVVLGAVSLLSGCVTTEATVPNGTAPEAAGATVSVVVSETTETTTVTNAAPPPSQPDILSGAKKPCGTVAADAPKFVEPETK